MRAPNIASGLLTLLIAAAIGRSAPQPRHDANVRLTVSQLRKELLTNSREEYQRLTRGDYQSSRIVRIRQLIRKEILRQLNAGFATADQFRAQLQPILQDAWEAPVSVLYWRGDGTPGVMVTYSILHGGAAQPDATAVIEAFSRVAGKYSFVAQTGEGLNNSLPRLEEIPSRSRKESWLLGHGQQTRVMQYYERIRIYSFDGRVFKERWATPPRPSPSFRVGTDSVEITYAGGNVGEESGIRRLSLTPAGVVENGRHLTPK